MSPTTWPGARLPHAWLDDGTALQDRLGDGYTLLCLGGTRADTAPLARAFAALAAPFSVMTVERSAAARHLRPRSPAAAARPAYRLAGKPPARPARATGGDRHRPLNGSRDETFPRHRRTDRHHGGAAHARQRLPVGSRAELRDHRALHHRGSIRSRRRDRPRRPRRPEGRARRPAAAGRVPRPHGRGARHLRIRRCRAGDHRKADPPPSACVRRQRRTEHRPGERPVGPDQG